MSIDTGIVVPFSIARGTRSSSAGGSGRTRGIVSASGARLGIVRGLSSAGVRSSLLVTTSLPPTPSRESRRGVGALRSVSGIVGRSYGAFKASWGILRASWRRSADVLGAGGILGVAFVELWLRLLRMPPQKKAKT